MSEQNRLRIAIGTVLIAIGGIQTFTVRAVGPADESKSIRTVGPGNQVVLPKPYATASARNRPKVVGWPAGRTPIAAPGFRVSLFADSFEIPRNVYVLPDGDVLVVESGTSGRFSADPANRITLLRDANKDGKPELREVFLSGLNWPYGMLLLGNNFYIGNRDGVVMYPYKAGQTKITAVGKKILDLPGPGGHYTRNLAASSDGKKIYVAVGSTGEIENSKNDVNDPKRSAILEMNPDGSGMRVYASGLRNPVGLAIEPDTKQLWVTVNERDNLGDDLVPDYLTGVREGGFYGWPFAYFGPNADPQMKNERADLVANTLVPDYSVGSHVTPLGIVFDRSQSLPAQYRGGAFVALHGGWNRAHFAGYKVVYIPFVNGKPTGDPQDILTGFIDHEVTPMCDQCSPVFGRPAGMAAASDGSLLLADDGGNVVWRISPKP